MNHNPHGLLLDKQIRPHFQPLQMHTEDWAHVYLCNGIGGGEKWQLLERLKARDVKYVTFREEMQLWKWPKHHTGGKGVWRLFSDARAKANKEGWKSSASEFLMIYPIVLDWISTNVREHAWGSRAVPKTLRCPGLYPSSEAWHR